MYAARLEGEIGLVGSRCAGVALGDFLHDRFGFHITNHDERLVVRDIATLVEVDAVLTRDLTEHIGVADHGSSCRVFRIERRVQ